MTEITVTILDGDTSTIVDISAYNYIATPAILPVPQEQIGGEFWVSAASATSFTLNVENPPIGTFTFKVLLIGAADITGSAYCTATEVETWAQPSTDLTGITGYDYAATIAYVIQIASRAIDEYLEAPEGYYADAGYAVANELHNSIHFGVLGWNLNKPLMRTNYNPVISVTPFETCDSSGSWTTRTVGQANDYLVETYGLRIIRNVPSFNYQDLRVTYVAGYATTPNAVRNVSARLAAALLQRIVDGMNRKGYGNDVSGGADYTELTRTMFSEELKDQIKRYRIITPLL